MPVQAYVKKNVKNPYIELFFIKLRINTIINIVLSLMFLLNKCFQPTGHFSLYFTRSQFVPSVMSRPFRN